MKKATKRVLAMLAAAALMLSLAACAPKNAGNDGDTAGEWTGDTLFSPDTEFSITFSSNTSWPFNENWKFWQYFKEAIGGNLKVTTIPSDDYTTKLPLMMASPEELPDAMHMFQKDQQIAPYALQGAFVSFDDNMDKMPNYSAFLDSLDEIERTDLIRQNKCGDGKSYSAISHGTHYTSGVRTWFYRQDVFEKHGLTAPKDYNELYEVCKKLKELYPNSYPLCFRDGLFKIEELTTAWKPYFSQSFYYDFNNEVWLCGAQDDIMKEIIAFFLKMTNEGLLNPDWLSITGKGWEELMSTDRGFISFDYAGRIDFFNTPMREQNPEYNLAFMAPPAANVEGGRQSVAKTNIVGSGYVIPNTGDEEGIANAFKFIDWLYTDEACELLSWGKEGETYEVVDGKKKYIISPDETIQVKYGVGTSGLWQRMDKEAFEQTLTPENTAACYQTLEYSEDFVHPGWWLSFNEEESKIRAQYLEAVRSYSAEQMSKFLLGQTPVTDETWADFQAGLIEMGVEQVLDTYTTAYNRAVGK